MKTKIRTDALVNRENALAWAKHSRGDDSEKAVDRLLVTEPYLFELVLHTAKHISDKVARAGLAAPLANMVFDNIVTSTATYLEVLQRGYRDLWDDLIPFDTSTSDGPAGNSPTEDHNA